MRECLAVLTGTEHWEVPVTDRFYLTEDFLPGPESGKYLCRRDGEGLRVDRLLLSPYAPESVDGATLIWFGGDTRIFPFPEEGNIRVGTGDGCDIRLQGVGDLFLVLEPGLLRLERGSVYHNGKRTDARCIPLLEGDCLVAGGFRITVWNRAVVLNGDGAAYRARLYDQGPVGEPFEGFPVYKRSPRMIKRLPDDTVNLANPPARAEKKRGRLLKMIAPPLVMLMMTVLVMIFIPRGLYAIIGIATTLTSTVITVTNYFHERKDAKQEEIARQKSYEQYLLRRRKELHALRQRQREAMSWHYPGPAEIAGMAREYSSRIYERSANESDFLTATVGAATHPSSYAISRSAEEVQAKEDPLLTEAGEIREEFSRVDGLPTVIDLKRAHLGIVGDKGHVQEQLMLLLAQLTFFQSYHDVEVVCLFDDKYRDRFRWLQWYPHCRIKAINVTGLVDSENVRDQVLGNLTQVLKERKLKREEQKKESLYLPHYLFVIDEPRLVINHSIMEYLQSPDSDLGFSLIYTTDMMASLPENIKTVMLLGDSGNGALVLNEGRLQNQPLQLNRIGETDLESVSRSLAALTHAQGVSTRIPESITFFEMYGVKHPEELGVFSRWRQSQSHKSLAVPLGVRAEDDLVLLNLHEKAHGPHGLVAGTTGSGKSEALQSYILSLAVNFHPHEVGFLLIDYKGGGMASLFRDLPHLLGMITNLDGGESMRAMASIKSELARRQRRFNEHGVNHINQYNKLFKAGEADRPMPHLFLISDEFAELKKEQPDFMSELVSAARIGRSLGVHLILATQKPTGVVDDQIWSNSKFKLALKVQDAADSSEVLKTPDAANITLPGRAYLQVGNNEIYELFQSAWSGAAYSKAQEEAGFDDRVYLVNHLGQRRPLGDDLSGGDGEESRLTQLDVLVAHLHEEYRTLDAVPVEKPWHPPLETNIVSPHVGEAADVSGFTALDSAAPLGMVDIPERQRQEELVYDFTRDGNLAVFGSSGYGKSVTLTTLLLTLAVKNSPALLRFFVIDLGNAALAQMRGLPHTADYISLDESDKLEKFIKLMGEEMQERKALLAGKNALNFTMYNAVSSEKMAAIVVAIDNYDVIRELGQDLEDFWTRLTRDGAGVGIYVVASATRSNAFKYVVLNNFKKKIAHHLIDQNDLVAVVGRTPYSLGEKPGRAFVKRANVNMMQMYTAVPCEDDIAYAQGVGRLVEGLRDSYSGKRAEGIRMLPEVLDFAVLLGYADGEKRGYLPVGLDFDEVEVQYLNLANPVHLILGTAGSGKTNVLRLALRSLESAERVFLIDSREMELSDHAQQPHIRYCSTASQMAELLADLREVSEERRRAFEAQSELLPRQFYATLPSVCVVIDDFDNFLELLKGSGTAEAEEIVKDSMAVGISCIAASLSTRMKGFDGLSKLFKEATSGLILGSPIAQTVWQIPGIAGYRPRPDGALLYSKGDVVQIKVPLVENANQLF